MCELRVYFARAMDDRSREAIWENDRKYTSLLQSIGAVVINPFVEKIHNLISESSDIADRDYALLRTSNLLLSDLSIPDYQYVGSIFEIAYATQNDIPAIVVVGEKGPGNRAFVQAYVDFIAKGPSEAIEYIRRTFTQKGIEEQMAEMKAYYDEIAPKYTDASVRTHKRNKEDDEAFLAERDELRKIIKKYVRGKACQIGIGAGDWTRTICEVADLVVGVEQSRQMLLQAHHNLSAYKNLRFLHCDALKENITGGPFDCVIIYFLLSLLPRAMRDRLFECVEKILKPGGLIVAADTKKLADLPAVGLGRYQLQQRKSGDKTFVLFKEHFVGDTLSKLLKKNNCKVIDSSRETVWFSWAVAYRLA